jgi:serine/threonine-protein phosphatase 2A regulatory subunit A
VPPACPPHATACRDELRDDDIALKLNSIRRLGTIAMALGDERTCSELLPYLLESKPEEDELMEALAEEVGKLVPMVGGPKHAHCLVPLLEELARQDETVVREAAVKALQAVGKDFTTEQAMAHLVPAIQVCGCALVSVC